MLSLYLRDPRVENITGQLGNTPPVMLHLAGTVGSAPAIIAAAVIRQVNLNHLFILPDKDQAAYFQNDLKALLPKKDIYFFPDSFKRPGQFQEANRNNILLRAEAITRFVDGHSRSEVMVTYPEALIEQVVRKKALKKHTIRMHLGEKLDLDFMIEFLVAYGFERTDFVYEPGQFSIRGGIVDVYSYGNDLPYRIELFDDEVESIRTFDPVSQRSVKKISRVTIIPDVQSHFSAGDKADLLEYLPACTVAWLLDAELILSRLEELEAQMESIQAVLKQAGEAEEPHPLQMTDCTVPVTPSGRFAEQLSQRHQVYFGKPPGPFRGNTVSFPCKPQPSFNRKFDLLIHDLQENTRKGILNFLFAGNPKQIERYYHIFEDMEAAVDFHPVAAVIHEGFTDTGLKIACYTDHQIFNRYHKYHIRESFSRSMALNMKALRELKPGDYVTHIDHGIGRYSGLEKLEINGVVQEAVRLVYKDNDLLYVGINSLHKISKYAGKEGQVPRINKLGSGAWEALKRKTRKKVKDIAKDLIKLYAERKARKGFAFRPDTYLQDKLEASFIYEDTPDQLKTTRDVKQDMEAPHPMDRLVCGDVGFGKTEVAVRAAFKAVTDNKQVAVLVPTTILALQHYRTFSERLENFPVTIDYLNRFKTATQRKKTLEALREGKIDIIIGTHALLGKQVVFKDLGLLIIDEEQKFGVAAKERLKTLKVNVDTLTLTATPIPRTLQFSLMGARDLSIIQTPPPNRQPIHTELHMFDDRVIRDAIRYELNRGGQVFFIHNRVKDIEDIAHMVERLCPEASVAVAHGQMDGKLLEKVMMDFIEQRHDVLVCTNIIESGLDIPNANTIIIHNAHRFGLSDLHQLRGRVGRSNRKAFCYLIAPPLSSLTTEARLRLTTVEEFADLGSGFHIAMRDLDIRGAGNLLGAEQSGFIAEIGFDMYHKILDEAILELKETEFRELFAGELAQQTTFVRDCQIDSDIELLIPDHYVKNIQERLNLYTRLNAIKTEEELREFRDQLADRFGPVPPEADELLNAMRLQWEAVSAGFERIVLRQGNMRCYFISNQHSFYYESEQFRTVLDYVKAHPRQCRMKQTDKHLILIFREVHSMEEARRQLSELNRFVSSRPV